jgi:hypothetical protein
MKWTVPRNIADLLSADSDQMWQDDQFEPLIITAMGGTLFGGRQVAVLWQIEFDPADLEGSQGEERIADQGHEPDGYGWTALILADLAQRYPACVPFVKGDEEAATCVICAEQADVFEKLVEVALVTISGDGDD